MRRRFSSLPLHWKLVTLALGVSTVALIVALAGLSGIDAWQYRRRTQDDTRTLAGIIAGNSAAAVAFQDRAAAEQTLGTVHVRAAVTRACIYLEDGQLMAAFERRPSLRCPGTVPLESDLGLIGATAPILYDGRSWGAVYVEEDFSGGLGRIALAAGAAVLMLLVAAGVAFVIAERLTRSISQPIAQLAREARRFAEDRDAEVPEIRASDDEIGELVRAFQAMLGRVKLANAGLLREIEERKKVQAEREALLQRERDANRLKDEFVATVAHELRTPLNPIMGWAQLLETTNPTPAMLSKAIEAISRNVRTQARIIEDLVDVSRISTGKLQLRKEVVDLRWLLDQSVEVAKSDHRAKRLEILVDTPPEPCLVNVDPDRMRQVVGNLLSNAIKFSAPDGKIFLTLSATAATCELEVRDEGSGIGADVLPFIFDRFRQADSSTSRRHEGLGLGLSIVRDVTEMHGGNVSATSAGPGRGASFRVRLARLSTPTPGESQSGAPAEALPRLDGVRVLVVDDNADALDMLAEALRSIGARVTTASSGSAALALWEREPPDVVLCDLAMPEMDGFGVITELKKKAAQTGRRAAAIAVSAHASSEFRRRSLQAGFVEHVTKPIRVPDLVQSVREALRT